MNRIPNEKCRPIMLEILDCIDDFCKLNNIRYSLCGGSLLGAIRHKGFIPWDDDIDLMMPRPDYERFIKSFNGYNVNMECFTCGRTHTHDSTKTFAKVQDLRTIVHEQGKLDNDRYGLFVDIFPIDGMPSSNSIFSIQLKLFRQIESVIRISNIDKKDLNSGSSKIKKLLSSMIGRTMLSKLSDVILTLFPYNNSKCAGIICGVYGLRDKFNKEVFQDYFQVEFEGKSYPSIENYDVYLSQLYGNYMELPPIEKRINHSIVAYWK